MSSLNLICDVCGREVMGCTFVNGMRFCAKCYQETFGNTNPFEKELREKIADIEAKLADMEANERLKQQLTETKEELVNCDNARIDWKNRAMTYAELIVSLNGLLPNKQEQEITFAKVIDDVKNLISQKDAEIVGRKKLCDLRYEQLDRQDKEIKQLKQQLAEKENPVVLKPDKYVIVTNGWKKQGYGIAKVHQEVRDVYYYCSNNRIGSFSPMTQYGEFETLEEAEAKLKELKKK